MEIEPTPTSGPEKAMLQAFLQQNRAIIVWKLDGLDDEMARRTPLASPTSVIGLLRHLTVVEKSWFEEIFAGREVEYGFDFDADRDAEFRLDGGETLDDAIAGYEAQVAVSNEIIAGSELDSLSALERRGDLFSLRWIILHMIEETGRHAGHLDILREMMDGSVGYMPDR